MGKLFCSIQYLVKILNSVLIREMYESYLKLTWIKIIVPFIHTFEQLNG